MAQAQRRPNRPAAGKVDAANQAERAAATVIALSRRQGRGETKPKPMGWLRRALRPAILLAFASGIGLGYGLAGPLPRLIGPVLAALNHTAPTLGKLVPALPVDQHRILILGSDQISGSTDVMVVVDIHDGTTKLTQVPRDTFIESSRFGVLKANALYASGGVEAVKEELTTLLSTPVDRYLLVNLDAVQNLAEALGGVEVDVPKRMYYTDSRQGLYIDLYPGPQLLKGKDLEGFLRFRNDELGDIGRMERQQLVIREVFRKLAQPSVVTRLPELLRIAGNDISTDLSPLELGNLISKLGNTRLSTDRLAGRLYWHDDLSYWMPDLNTEHAASLEPETGEAESSP
ncbi:MULTISPECIES: LCP family protein [unclassified Synechococcus]|uniref:LCP family protein n=1 Tax=unclassified Synechococcus TaxID=2626047 RepID=UPI0000698377|nr:MULTISPECIES: LCP family protein [unclassified Synechococcus]EAQ75715.1 membrane bound transcriptional regulator-like protein [Synechococcus sp. WH 5701]WFN59615.1 LCP family protein [Synechococcus sp. CCFWC 502]